MILSFEKDHNYVKTHSIITANIRTPEKITVITLKGQGSIRAIFGLKILENMKLFNVLEFYSQYKDKSPLYLKICLKC